MYPQTKHTDMVLVLGELEELSVYSVDKLSRYS